MKHKTIAVVMAIICIAVVSSIIYTRPWVTKITIYSTEGLESPLMELKKKFESQNPFVEVRLIACSAQELIAKLTAEGEVADVVVVEDYSLIPNMLYKARLPGTTEAYVDWYAKFAYFNETGIGNQAICGLTIPRNTQHLSLAIEFVKFVVGEDGRSTFSAFGSSPIVPVQGFGGIPDELKALIKEMRVLVDQAGREVILPKQVNKVVTLIPMSTVIVCSIDGKEKLVGIDETSSSSEFFLKVNPELKELPVVGTPWKINEEELLRLNPDVVITLPEPAKLVKRMEELGIPVFCLNMQRVECKQLPEIIRLVGTVIGKEEQSLALATYYEEKLEMILNVTSELPKGEKPKVFLAIGEGLTTHLAPLTLSIMRIAGMQNVAENISWIPGAGPPVAEVSMEALLKWDPSIILSFDRYTKSAIESDPRFTGIDAVRNGRIYVIPSGCRSWFLPEPESILGLMWVAQKLHPDKFTFDLEKEAKEFYSRFFGYEISDEELSKVFGGEYKAVILEVH
jgi:iron complex transport system substrate-binding protein